MSDGTRLESFTKWYLAKFKTKAELKEKRIGLKKEYPVINRKTFEAADIRIIFPLLIKLGWTPVFEWTPLFDGGRQEEMVGVKNDGGKITAGIGWCTLVVSIPPQPTVFLSAMALEEIEAELAKLCRQKGMLILGYGAQPVTYPDKTLWTEKYRARFTKSYSLSPSEMIPIMAADRVCVDVAQEEIADAVDALNALSGPVAWLFANSPIWRGEVDPLRRLTTRMDAWSFTGRERSGIPPKIFNSNDSLLAYMLGIMPRNWFEKWPEHESALWFDARPRAKYGTLEFISACSQKSGENRHLMALILGLVENLSGTKKLLGDYILRNRVNLRKSAVYNPPSAAMEKVVEEMLNVAQIGLERRGFGEEMYIAHLRTRIAKSQNPAIEALQIFRRQGYMPQFIDSVDILNAY